MSTVTISLPEALAKAAAAQEAGQFVEAERLCQAILGAEPDHFQATLLLAIIQHRRGRLVAAVESYNRTLALRPACSEAFNNRGLALHELDRFADALASYDTALAIRPDDAEVLNNRGIALDEMGCLEQALASYDKAVAIQPHYATALSNRGNTLQKLKRLDEAVASYDKALEVQPDHVAALIHRGQALQALARFEEALASYDTALAVQPNFAEAHFGRGDIFQAQERYADALLNFDRALAARPDWIAALHNRGLILQALGRLHESLASFDEALAVRPDYVEAYSNRGNLLMDFNRPEAALASYDRATSIQPDHAIARWGGSLCLLLLGEFDRGWREYESRWLVHPKRVLPQPLWLGDADITGKTILLHSEQGIGDTIQFCRYAKLLARQGVKVVLEVQREVATLLASLDPTVRIIARGDPIPAFDVHVPLLSLPLAFKTTLDSIPAETAYLRAPAEKLKLWQDRLGVRTKPRIGLVWAGNPRTAVRASRVDRLRSIAFDQLAPLFAATDCEFYSLQKGTDAVAQLRQSAWRGRVVDWTDELNDFADTAALVECLDLVITVDTSVAHLAGALGRPFWLMNRFNTCWRWLLDRDDSPWYPTVRIFRQPGYGDWTSVIESVAAALRLRDGVRDARLTPCSG
jgi:tetratricopeptide (TPR) repeat protein